MNPRARDPAWLLLRSALAVGLAAVVLQLAPPHPFLALALAARFPEPTPVGP